VAAPEREQRTAVADDLCATAYGDSGGPDTGIAMIAVGGFGRGELAPYSDLDVVLVHDDDVDPGPLAEKVWYPLWDSGANLDHSVRSLSETVAAGDDLRVALGMLDARHLAGDPNLTLRLRTTMLAQWRRQARDRLPELRRMVEQRHAIMGELAHASVPDLKESAGGLRDATVLNALVATWLVDVPHADLERCRQSLLDVRDQVQAAAGRAVDRVAPEVWASLVDRLGVADERAAQAQVRELGRRLTHLSRLTWRRVDAVLDRPASARGARDPGLVPIGGGLALASGEVVLAARVRPAADPLLLLRAAAEAAERDAVLSPATTARLVREAPPLPDPWPAEARQLLVRLLAAGPGLLGVWETLEETGALGRFLPEWDRLRSLPHASVVHRFTVDRHVVETCIEASALIRYVGRPDVLMVAALLHDIGKGGLTEHCRAGEPIARAVATRMGFEAHEVDLVATLVRRHLLLAEAATTRDPDDPATVEHVARRIGSAEALDLLLTLTEADARATAPKAWSAWRAGLVRRLATRVRAVLAGSESQAPEDATWEVELPDHLREDPARAAVLVEPTGDGSRVTVVSGDRIGLLADAAALFALQRTSVRAARAWTQDQYGVSVWDVAEDHLDPAVLRQRMAAITEGRVDVRERLARPASVRLEPAVEVRPEASRSATVLEVRTDDLPGTVHLVCRALAALEITVRSAHVDTLGPQAVDVFYLQETGAGALSDDRAAAAAHAVRAALSPADAGS